MIQFDRLGNVRHARDEVDGYSARGERCQMPIKVGAIVLGNPPFPNAGLIDKYSNVYRNNT